MRVGGRRAVDYDVVPLPGVRPARRPHAGRAPPGCPAMPKVLRAQPVPARIPGTWRPASRRPRATAPPAAPSVSSASASRKPPPASAPRRPARGSARGCPVGVTGDAEHVAERVRLVGGHHQHPQAAARVAHRGRGRQRRLAYAALADEETDPGPAGSGAVAGLHSALDSFLQVLQCGVGQPSLGLALEQADHRDDQVDRQLVGDIGARSLGRQAVCTVERLQQRTRDQRPASPIRGRAASRMPAPWCP